MGIKDYFRKEKLLKIYNEKIQYSTHMGIDKISNYKFEENLEKNINKIINDIKNNRYMFKPYKVVLIPKNVESKPRKICIATIRDRLVIEVIKEYLYDEYSNYNLNCGVSNLVNSFIYEYNNGNYYKYIKTDLTTYFDSVDHKLLIKKIKKQVKDETAMNLIIKLLENVQRYNDNDNEKNKKGIPQGLSISMLLANIFMHDIDNFFSNKRVKYFRYVDDIFLLCKHHTYFYFIILKLKLMKNKLKLNKKKTVISNIKKPFIFLGYSIKEDCISVKIQSIKKLEVSLENIFKNYKTTGNKDELLWRLNIRISGAISNNKKYGWLFYFNSINDKKLLYKLDHLVEKLKKRYKVKELKNKTFLETYYQIKNKNIKNNEYFFNVDKCSEEEKIIILNNISNISIDDIQQLTKKELDLNYRKAIFKCLKSLERDLDNIS